MSSAHTSVLLHEVIEALSLKAGAIVLDGTVGGGGHALAICERIGENGILIGMDLDETALERGRKRLITCSATIHLVNRNFNEMETAMSELGISGADAILLDLGLSSDQLETSGRGFSFKMDEPLQMTFSANPEKASFTARDIINEWNEADIANVLYGYGEERYARRIAKRIVEVREKQPIETTHELVEVVQRSVPRAYLRGRIHPATRTFQALRIAVNDELKALERGLTSAIRLLYPSGRLAVISFHSIEDRVVKQTLNEAAKEGEGTVLTKKPIIPTREEIQENPRARSAKLRVFQKA